MYLKKSMFVVERPQENGDCVLYCSETGAIVVLNPEAKNMWDNSTWDGFPIFDELVRLKYLVPDDEDQVGQQMAKRRAFKNPSDAEHLSFTIAPTLFCNANCAYCFEQGARKSRMSPDTEKATVDFIISTAKSYGAEKISISWFGGEPLLEKALIDRVSLKLIAEFGAENYSAAMITNGSLIDEDTISLFKRAKISTIQITLDGTEHVYNRIKAYNNPAKYNYQRVVSNIELCCKNEIFVSVRFNISQDNQEDVMTEINKLAEQFNGYKKYMKIYVYQITGEKDDKSLFSFYSPEFVAVMNKFMSHLADLGYVASFRGLQLLPRSVHCAAHRYHSYQIDPNGLIYKCEHFLGQDEHAVGNVSTGIDENSPAFKQWKNTDIPEKCSCCKLLPICQGGCTAREGSNLEPCAIQLPTLGERLDLAYKFYKKEV